MWKSRMRVDAGVIGPRGIVFGPDDRSREPCYSFELWELTVVLSWMCCLFISALAEADAICRALWPGGRRDAALVQAGLRSWETRTTETKEFFACAMHAAACAGVQRNFFHSLYRNTWTVSNGVSSSSAGFKAWETKKFIRNTWTVSNGVSSSSAGVYSQDSK